MRFITKVGDLFVSASPANRVTARVLNGCPDAWVRNDGNDVTACVHTCVLMNHVVGSYSCVRVLRLACAAMNCGVTALGAQACSGDI